MKETQDKIKRLLATKRPENIELALYLSASQQLPLETLNLSMLRFDRIPKDFFRIPGVRHLLINETGIKEINEELCHFESLNSISIAAEQIKQLPEALLKLKQLKVIKLTNLSHLDWKHAFELIYRLPQLEVLHLHQNHLKVIPDGIAALKGLKVLNINSEVELFKLPADFEALHRLEYLLFNRMEADFYWKAAFKQIGKLPRLKFLKIQSCQLKKIDPEIGNILSLQSLSFGHNSLYNLPESLSKLKYLVFIDLSGNHYMEWGKAFRLLRELPYFSMFKWGNGQLLELNKLNEVQSFVWNDSFMKANWEGTFELLKELPALERLSIINRTRKALPDSIRALTNLKTLKIRKDIYPVDWPQYFSQLAQIPSLQSLDIASNEFKTLAPELFTIKTLKRLDLSKNQLAAIPRAIGNFKYLEKLQLHKNHLTTINLEGLSHLKELQLSDNYLQELGRGLDQSTHLRILNLSNNCLEGVFELSEAWADLEVLDLSYNQLGSLGMHLSKLQQLQSLDLRGNRLLDWKLLFPTLLKLGGLEAVTCFKGVVLPLKNIDAVDELNLKRQLDKLPENRRMDVLELLTNYKYLKVLKLDRNRLKSLPESFKQLKQLKVLDLRKNSISYQERPKIEALLPTGCKVYW